MGETAVNLENLTVRFGTQTVLDRFFLSLAPGQAVTLSGPSGCGKSTVLRCLLGLQIPEAGHVRILDEEMTARSVWRLRRHLAYVPQEPDLGTGRVGELLQRPLAYRANASCRKQLERLPEWLEQVELPADIVSKSITDLSGGEKQRVALVGALLLDRPVLLLDEVTAALDAERRRCVADLIRASRTTRLIVTHDHALFDFANRHVTLAPSNGEDA
jgi:ABC-type iron transport system FetAB ATPase subunit